jgi:hypothetical protein
MTKTLDLKSVMPLPEKLIVEAERVAVVVRGRDHVVHDEVRGNRPRRLRCSSGHLAVERALFVQTPTGGRMCWTSKFPTTFNSIVLTQAIDEHAKQREQSSKVLGTR